MQPASAQDLRVESALSFVGRHLRDRTCRILDAGCGEGRLVERLTRAGHAAHGVDVSEEAVARATAAARNVTARDFLDVRGDRPYDVIYFGSSLHHIHPLDRGIEHAASLLRPGGLLLADEFDLAAADEVTARWFFDAIDVLRAAGLVEPGNGHHGGSSAAHDPAADPLDRWHAKHQHDPPLATGKQMLAALRSRFEVTGVERRRDLYWYPLRDLDRLPQGRRVAEGFAALERVLLAAGRIRPVGLRIVARPR